MLLKEICDFLDNYAPLSFQESYDNSGLLIGDYHQTITSALLCIDITEDVIDEAIGLGSDLIIAHHPLIFAGLKKFTGNTNTERAVIKAIRHNIAVYSAHTNWDSIINGVNHILCHKLGLVKCKVLSQLKNELLKLVTFVPVDYADLVRLALFEAGAGHIGNYDQCSFNSEGAGTFRGNETSKPFIGEKNKLHKEPEIRIETILPKFLLQKVVKTLIDVHPYEEVAYDLYPLMNPYSLAGMGLIGELSETLADIEFLQLIKRTLNVGCLRHTKLLNKKVKHIAVCGGSGSFLIKDAIASRADVFITGDIKYHQFFDAEDKIILVDAGHFETEQFTIELFYDILTKKFPTFAAHFSKIKTNPINYL